MTNIDILGITIHVSVPGGTGKMSGLARQTLKSMNGGIISMNKTELVAAIAEKTELTEGRNPQTGETMKIAASKAPKFKAGKALKDAIN